MSDLDYEKLADLISTQLVVKLKKDQDHQRDFSWAINNIFAGKSRQWIKYWIISKHPEILTSNGGWLTEPCGPGKPIRVISEKAARKWLKENRSKIDWNAPEPVTIRRREGLAKPIKRRNK